MLQRSAPKLGHASPPNIFWGDINGCKWGSRWSGSTPLAPKPPPQEKGELKNPAKKWKWKWRYGCVPASKSWPSLVKSFFNNLGPATHTGFPVRHPAQKGAPNWSKLNQLWVVRKNFRFTWIWSKKWNLDSLTKGPWQRELPLYCKSCFV